MGPQLGCSRCFQLGQEQTQGRSHVTGPAGPRAHSYSSRLLCSICRRQGHMANRLRLWEGRHHGRVPRLQARKGLRPTTAGSPRGPAPRSRPCALSSPGCHHQHAEADPKAVTPLPAEPECQLVACTKVQAQKYLCQLPLQTRVLGAYHRGCHAERFDELPN